MLRLGATCGQGLNRRQQRVSEGSRLRPWFWMNEGKAGRWLLSPLVWEVFEMSHGPQYEKFVVQEDKGGEDSVTVDTGNDD